MRVLAAIAVLIVLGLQPALAQDGDKAADKAPGKAEPPSPTETFILGIYKTYTDAPEDGPVQDGVEDIYSKRLQALIDKDVAETPEGEVGRLDFDPFVDGQDWELGAVKVKEIYRSGGEARVRADFANFGKPRSIVFSLVREDGAWRIDDIAGALPPRWSLSEILTAPLPVPVEVGE